MSFKFLNIKNKLIPMFLFSLLFLNSCGETYENQYEQDYKENFINVHIYRAFDNKNEDGYFNEVKKVFTVALEKGSLFEIDSSLDGGMGLFYIDYGGPAGGSTNKSYSYKKALLSLNIDDVYENKELFEDTNIYLFYEEI